MPGLNSCIKAAVYRADDEGHQMVGIRRGWAGLLHLNPDNPLSAERHTVPLTKANTRTIDRTGGTYLHTSRTNPARVKAQDVPEFLAPAAAGGPEPVDCTAHVLRVIEHLKLDGVLAIGGDDTLSYAVRLDREGVPIVCIP